MKSLHRYTLTAIFSLLMVFTVAAQQGEIVPLDDEKTVFVPSAWALVPADGYDLFFSDVVGMEGNFLINGKVYVMVMTPAQLDDLLGQDAPTALDARMGAAFSAVYLIEVETPVVEDVVIGGLTGAKYAYQIEDAGGGLGEGEGYLLVDPAGGTFFVSIYGLEGTIAESRDDIGDILNSLGGDIIATSADSEPCFISTDRSQTVVVRVGPGENRSVITYLAPDTDYRAERRFIDPDGGVWYRLDKNEVDPGTSAAELWTAAADVTATGGCDTLGTADAPPIRPIIAAGATLAPGQTGGIAPLSGTWTLIYDQLAVASCAGSTSVSFNIEDLDLSTTQTVEIFAPADGSFFTYDGYFYLRLNETAYLGDATIDNINTQVYFFPESPDRMRSETRFNYVIEGFNCSSTIHGTAVRQ